ncbi:hypothetical protein K9N50_11005 [bacterium]|nr:hypothetical protein [bacterium]
MISNDAFAIFEHRTNNPNLDPRSRATSDVNLGIVNPLAALENPAYLNQIKKAAAQFVVTGESGYPNTTNSSIILGFRTDYAVLGMSVLYRFESYETHELEIRYGLQDNTDLEIGLHCATKFTENIHFGVSTVFGYEEKNSRERDYHMVNYIGTGVNVNTGIFLNNLFEKTTLIYDNNAIKGFSMGISLQNLGQKFGYRTDSPHAERYTPWFAKINASWKVIYREDYHLIAGCMYRLLLVDYKREELRIGDDYTLGFGIEGRYNVFCIRLGKVYEYRHYYSDYYETNSTKSSSKPTFGFGLDFGKVFFDISTRKARFYNTVKWISIGMRI